MPQVRTNGIQVYYEVHGSGEPLLLIAGLGYGLWMWHKMIPRLAEHFQVIAFDNRGAGETDKPEGPYSVQMLAADTAGLLEALEIESAMVMGHSMGGLLVQILGSRGLGKALVLLTPASPYGIMALKSSVIRSFWSGFARWCFWRKPMRQTFAEAAYSTMHLLPAEEQRRLGANPDICPIYDMCKFHLMEDDKDVLKLFHECTGGIILCGECKAKRFELLSNVILNHNKKKLKFLGLAREILDKE